jgi:hypothetical protein
MAVNCCLLAGSLPLCVNRRVIKAADFRALPGVGAAIADRAASALKRCAVKFTSWEDFHAFMKAENVIFVKAVTSNHDTYFQFHTA